MNWRYFFMRQQLLPAPWNAYADDAAHYCYVRCLDFGNLYEVVRVTHDKHGQQAEFVHQVIFMSEYDESAMTEVLKGFGYESLDAFVCETNCADAEPAGFGTRPDGGIDRAASPSWWIDYMLFASLLAEHAEGRMMTVQAADDLANAVVVMNPIAPNPFYIHRTFGGQLVSIPLCETEVNMICTIKDEQIRRKHLLDEISDLGEDDPCFDGCSLSSLLDNEDLLADIQRRWYHYNGNGGNHTENLREAVKVTIHAHFPKV